MAGGLLYGLGIGNLLTLPQLIAQAESPLPTFAAIIALVTAVNQAKYTFGTGLFGAAAEIWRAQTPPTASGLLHLLAATVQARRGRPPSWPNPP